VLCKVFNSEVSLTTLVQINCEHVTSEMHAVVNRKQRYLLYRRPSYKIMSTLNPCYNALLIIQPKIISFLTLLFCVQIGYEVQRTFLSLVKRTSRQTVHSSPSSANNKKLRGFSPQANYTDRGTAACQRSYSQL
jgi:hypothetical protein